MNTKHGIKIVGEIYFDHVNVQDCIVLGWDCTLAALRIRLHVSLLPKHPQYMAPLAEDRSCFVSGKLVFPNPRNLSGLDPMDQVTPSLDPDGSLDYDTLHGVCSIAEGYYLEGEFGSVILASDAPVLLLAGTSHVYPARILAQRTPEH